MKASTKAMLWVLLVFVIGAAFGAAVVKLSQRSRLVADDQPAAANQLDPESREAEKIPEIRPQGPSNRFPNNAPGGLSRGALERMLSRLDMTPEQATQAREILENARLEYQRVDQHRMQQQRTVRQRALGQLRDILNPRQRRQLRVFLSQFQQSRPRPDPPQRQQP